MTRYLLDTNIYIDFYDRYYRFAYFPSFWEAFKTVLNTQIIIPKVVIDEAYQSQAFRDWLKNSYTGEYLNHKDYANE